MVFRFAQEYSILGASDPSSPFRVPIALSTGCVAEIAKWWVVPGFGWLFQDEYEKVRLERSLSVSNIIVAYHSESFPLLIICWF